MTEESEQTEDIGAGDAPVTLLCLNESYWLYQGEAFLNDMLFCRGAYPFQVRCVTFEDHFEMNRFAGSKDASVATMWRVNPDIVARLRKDELLIEIFSTDV